MADPVNGLLAARMDPERRRRIGNALLAYQYDRETPQDAAVTERAGLFPLGTYANGQTGPAWPGIIATPVEKMAQVLRGEITPGTPEFNEAGFDIAGAAMVGGLAAARPRNSVGTFAGRRAQTADQAALAKAEEMTAQGMPREQIWTDTGWFRGVDGKWRWEIDDSGATVPNSFWAGAMGDAAALPEGAANFGGAAIGRLEHALRHSGLQAAYPDLSSVPTSIEALPTRRNRAGEMVRQPPGEAIYGRYDPPPAPDYISSEGIAVGAPDAQGARSGLLHEIQHAVQSREGMADGGSTAVYSADDYNRLAGEVEARAVQKRMDMTPEERRARPPWLDYDVPEANQIVNLYANARPGAALGAGLSGASERQGIRAYHGSPHDFDKFDMSKIGTGEGAQAYGHGLYFAENEGVAKSYRDTTSGRNANVAVQTNGVRQLIGMLQNDPPKLEQALRATAAHMEATGTDTGRVAAKEAIAVADSIRDGTFNAGSGRMYEVNIKASPDDFLDWDKPLSQQSEKVRAGLNKLWGGGLDETAPAMRYAPQMPEMVEKAKNLGIPGIKYLDQGSRASGEGSRNYVVFDANLIEILRKYGLLGMLGAGGMAQELLKPSQPNIPDDAA